jgi:DNA-binding MarR family transcriptional regulator
MAVRVKRKEFAKPPHVRTGRRLRAKLDIGKLNEHVGYFVRRLQREVFKDFMQTLAPLDVRPAQYSVLLLIASNSGRSQSEIGQALDIERAALAKMLHELEEHGWVKRVPSITDGRSHSLFLTPGGRESLERIKALATEHESHMTRLLGKRRRQQLIKLLKDFG